MSKRYPTIGNVRARDAWRKNPKGAPQCVAPGCGCKATHRVDVEVNCFRGDDEVGNACPLHKNDAAAVLQGIEARRLAVKAQPAPRKHHEL
ncbi:hypothetical protein [Comamonas sp.]|uniref:hypothetical protein n=1 Tax=Comamonas sp. TaxID=34028 RepID=UPI00289BED1E|nr:hypothetical protein [Comamonas sp.]